MSCPLAAMIAKLFTLPFIRYGGLTVNAYWSDKDKAMVRVVLFIERKNADPLQKQFEGEDPETVIADITTFINQL